LVDSVAFEVMLVTELETIDGMKTDPEATVFYTVVVV